jgi:hypothetical protein
MRKAVVIRIIPVILLLLFLSSTAFGQYGEPKAIIAYAADEFELEIVDAGGNILTNVTIGTQLSEGDTVRTNGTVAELSLDPNGSIIKLAPNTVFTIKQFQRSDDTVNDFHMVAGKLRTIAARGSLTNRYRLSTPSAVCGVRGTDFGLISVPGSEERAFVVDGLIDYTNNVGQTISLASGEIADALAATFEAIQASQQQMQDLLSDMVFEQLDPNLVPGHTPQVEEQPPAEEEQQTEAPAEEPQAQSTPPEEAESPPLAEEAVKEAPVLPETATAAESGKAKGDGALGKLGNILGLQIGTVTIDGLTYSKAVLQPVFELGKLKAALYLPIIYTNDLFDSDDWYRPRGNNEWSFGTDQDWEDDPLDAAGDLFSDIFLKIRYVEYGDNRDPFYLRLGNLRTMTIGHGILMKDYANDFDFPAIRRIGFNTGIQGNKIGLEAVVNDLSKPEIFGGRLVLRPFGKAFPLGFGFSGIIDIDPDSITDPLTAPTDMPSDIMISAAAVDLELPVIQKSALSIVLYGDMAAMVPIIDGNFEFDAVWEDGASSISGLRNYGVDSGLFGNIIFLDYRLSYRYYDGVFHPTLFGPNYERLRGIYAVEAYNYLQDPSSSDYDRSVMGIYGEAGATLFQAFRIEASYFGPWSPDGGEVEEDEMSLTLSILPEVIPVLGIYGSVTYSRTKFFPLLAGSSDEDLSLFDAYAAFSGEIVYPAAPTLDIALSVGTAMKYDGQDPVYNDDGTPDMAPSFTLETRIHF